MKIDFDKKTGLPKVTFSQDQIDKDLADAKAIARMMRTDGWKILERYKDISRESILDNIKDCASSIEKRDLCSQRGAVLKGWDECRTLAERIVKRAESYLTTEVQEDDAGD